MSKRRLLLADDSMTIQKVVSLTFADEGIEVVAVSDGDAAMQKFVEAVPDLVMVDVNMPGLDGYRLCEMIKQDEETQAIPVILLVGSFEPFDEEEARRVGANDFLTKPFQSIRQLVEKVSNLLDAKTDKDNFLYPIENADAPVGSLAESAKMIPSDELNSADIPTENLGDAGMDDEMIQTAQIGSLPVDETHKYESETIYESFAENIDPADLKQSSDSRSLTDELEKEDWAKTQPLSKDDLEVISGISMREKTAPALDFDDLDLFEFPQAARKETSSANISPDVNEFFDKTSDKSRNKTDEISEPDVQTFAVALPQMVDSSPELIEAIADRVVEKLSSKVIKQIVEEVLSQMEGKR